MSFGKEDVSWHLFLVRSFLAVYIQRCPQSWSRFVSLLDPSAWHSLIEGATKVSNSDRSKKVSLWNYCNFRSWTKNLLSALTTCITRRIRLALRCWCWQYTWRGRPVTPTPPHDSSTLFSPDNMVAWSVDRSVCVCVFFPMGDTSYADWLTDWLIDYLLMVVCTQTEMVLEANQRAFILCRLLFNCTCHVLCFALHLSARLEKTFLPFFLFHQVAQALFGVWTMDRACAPTSLPRHAAAAF